MTHQCNGGPFCSVIDEQLEEFLRLSLDGSWDECEWCEWRRRKLHTNSDDTDADERTCDTKHWKIRYFLHLDPGNVWKQIINTGKLCWADAERSIVRGKDLWVRIPLLCDKYVQPSDTCYGYGGCNMAPNDTVKGFHNTRLESLVQGTLFDWNDIVIGNGILIDGRLCFGICYHGLCRGVNIYCDDAHETFEGSMGWVQLEVICTKTTKIKGGRSGRYCIKGPAGQKCKHAAVIALWILKREVPPVIMYS